MEDWRQRQLQAAETVLGQTAGLFAERGDAPAVDMLRAVVRLDFEQTNDGFHDETNWHDYYWAAVFFVQERDMHVFTDTVLEHLLPTLAEVARQNGQDHVDRVHIRPALPDVDGDWRANVGVRPNEAIPQPSPLTSPLREITRVTRQRLFDALTREGTVWAGSLDEVDFLRRLYDLTVMESFDSRFPTAEDDIIQHRYNNPLDWDDDWIFTDSRFGLNVGSDEVLLSFLAEMIHPEVRTDTEEVERLLALFNDALARDGYRLAPAGAISGYPIYEARRTVAHRASTARMQPDAEAPLTRSTPPGPTPTRSSAAAGPAGYDAVRSAAHGERADYKCDRLPVATGGQAEVFRATHKPSGTVVALKKLHQRYPGEHPTARMKREIEIGRHLDGHPHAMPVLDSAANYTWFVMPWAEATAEHRREELQQPGQLRALVDAIASVLAAVPEAGWIHRDIKPSNILLLDGRWTLADWGIGRRPPGQTTKIGRTGLALGTEGFAAPELSEDAHGATVASDIYSIGRVIAWALTGQMPKANLDLFPPPGPWRNIVKATTRNNPQHRPQTIDDLLALIMREHIDHPEDPIDQANVLLEAAHGGKLEAAEGLLLLVDNHDQDYELHINVLTGLAIAQAAPILARELPLSRRILRAFAEHVDGDETHRVQFGEAAGAIEWLHGVAVWAADRQQWDLLEEAAGAMCEWDGAWDQYRPQGKIRPWLQALTGEAAVTVAAVLREHPNSAKHFSGLAKNRAVDVRVRNAVTEQSFASRKPARQKEPLSLAAARSGARPDIALAPADVRKAEVLSKAVQRGAEWLYQFRTQPTFHKIRDSVQDPLYAAQAVLHRDDPATFDDLTLRRLFDGFRQYLDTFCDHLADMDPQAGFSQIPVEWRTSDRDRYRETNEVLKRTRDEFIAAYDALFEQLVRKGLAS